MQQKRKSDCRFCCFNSSESKKSYCIYVYNCIFYTITINNLIIFYNIFFNIDIFNNSNNYALVFLSIVMFGFLLLCRCRFTEDRIQSHFFLSRICIVLVSFLYTKIQRKACIKCIRCCGDTCALLFFKNLTVVFFYKIVYKNAFKKSGARY